MPSGDQMMSAVEYLDCAIKFEILLTSFHAVMKFTAMLEICVVVLMGGFFIRSPTTMWFYLFHLPHIGRGIVAWMLTRKVPLPQDFI